MASLSKYFVVLPFNEDKHGRLVPGDAREAPGAEMAIRWAKKYAHAIAFYRTGDPITGDWDEAVIIAQVGVPDKIVEAMAA